MSDLSKDSWKRLAELAARDDTRPVYTWLMGISQNAEYAAKDASLAGLFLETVESDASFLEDLARYFRETAAGE